MLKMFVLSFPSTICINLSTSHKPQHITHIMQLEKFDKYKINSNQNFDSNNKVDTILTDNLYLYQHTYIYLIYTYITSTGSDICLNFLRWIFCIIRHVTNPERIIKTRQNECDNNTPRETIWTNPQKNPVLNSNLHHGLRRTWVCLISENTAERRLVDSNWSSSNINNFTFIRVVIRSMSQL